MQKHVETYACEWKKAIETPQILQRFRHFVNSDAPDPGHRVRHRARAADSRMRVCRLEDIVPDTGVCALVDGEQVAVFRVRGERLRRRQPRPVLRRQRPLARHRRRPEGRAGRRLAGLQAALQPADRALRRGRGGAHPGLRRAGGGGLRRRRAGEAGRDHVLLLRRGLRRCRFRLSQRTSSPVKGDRDPSGQLRPPVHQGRRAAPLDRPRRAPALSRSERRARELGRGARLRRAEVSARSSTRTGPTPWPSTSPASSSPRTTTSSTSSRRA